MTKKSILVAFILWLALCSSAYAAAPKSGRLFTPGSSGNCSPSPFASPLPVPESLMIASAEPSPNRCLPSMLLCQVNYRLLPDGAANYDGSCAWNMGADLVCSSGQHISAKESKCVPDCVAPQVEDQFGKCSDPPDPCKEKENTSAGSFTVPGSSSPSGGFCFNGCSIGMIGNGVLNANGSKTYSDSIHLGSKCTVGSGTGPAGGDYWDPTADPTKPPGTSTGGGSGGDGGGTGTCSNGGTDYPTCTAPGGAGTCSNGGTNYPTCTPPTTDPGTGGGTGGGTGSGQAVCGGPGLPACAVNINESGPSNVVGEGYRLSDEFNRAADARITGFSNETKLLEVPWSLTFSLPASTCRPLEWVVLGTVRTFDPCPLFQRVREGLAYLLYGLCAIYLWKRLTNAQGGF